MAQNIEQIIYSIRQLPLPDQEKLRKLLEKGNGTSAINSNGDTIDDRSPRSLQWLNANRMLYVGQWIALDGDRFVAAGKSAREVYDLAKSEGVQTPFVELVTEEETTPSTGGWLS